MKEVLENNAKLFPMDRFKVGERERRLIDEKKEISFAEISGFEIQICRRRTTGRFLRSLCLDIR